jgi:DNA damage-inducible protein 1
MKLLVNLENTEDFREFDITIDDPLEILKYIIEAEFNIQFKDQEVMWNNQILSNDKKTINGFNIKENDIIIVRKAKAKNIGSAFDNIMKNIDQNCMSGSKADDMMKNISGYRVKNKCRRLSKYYLSTPSEMSILLNTDEKLANAILTESEEILEKLVKGRMDKYEAKKKNDSDEMLRLHNADPNDKEAQRRIAEINNLKLIKENLEYAQNYMPESFSFIHMLYIPVEINKVKLTALVDTGAQTTIMSVYNAEKCGLRNLIDTRYTGIAKGVGKSKIIGVIHAAVMKVGDK